MFILAVMHFVSQSGNCLYTQTLPLALNLVKLVLHYEGCPSQAGLDRQQCLFFQDYTYKIPPLNL